MCIRDRIFTAENAQISKEIQGYLTAIPEKYLDFVEAFVNDEMCIRDSCIYDEQRTVLAEV